MLVMIQSGTIFVYTRHISKIRLEELLSKAAHIEVLNCGHFGDGSYSQQENGPHNDCLDLFWDLLQEVISERSEDSPRIWSIKVAMHGMLAPVLYATDRPSCPHFTENNFLCPPLTHLAGGPISHRAEGYRIQYSTAAPLWAKASFRISKVACYLYGQDSKDASI